MDAFSVSGNITKALFLQEQIVALEAELAQLVALPAVAGGVGFVRNSSLPTGDEGDDSKVQAKTLIAVATIVVTLIVCVSIAFEKGQEWLEEHTIDVLMPILKGIFGELTILGFIGLLMFMVTKVGKQSLNSLVCRDDNAWWGNDEEVCPHNETTGKWDPSMGCRENPLIELTETAHMILFFVMMIFMAQAVMLIELAMNRMADWARYEDKCSLTGAEKAVEDHRNAKAQFQQLGVCMRRCTGCYKIYAKSCSCCLRNTRTYRVWYHYRDSEHLLEYLGSRSAFIKSYNSNSHEASNSHHRLRGDFDFAQYSLKTLARSLKDIVQITPMNWAMLWVIFALFLAADFVDLVTNSQSILLMACAIFGGYLSCAFVLAARFKVSKVKSLLVHPMHLHDGHPLRDKTLLARGLPLTGIGIASNLNSVNTARTAGWDSTEREQKLSSFQGAQGGIRRGQNRDSAGIRRLSQAKKMIADMAATNVLSTDTLDTPLLLNPDEPDDENNFTSLVDHVMRSDTPPNITDRGRERRSSLKVIFSKEMLLEKLGLVQTNLNEEHKPLYRYHFDGSELEEPPMSSICGCMGKHTPNHHEALFWGGKYGPELFYGYIRTQLVVISLYLGVSVVVFQKPCIEYFEDPENLGHTPGIQIWGPLAICLVALAPIVFMLFELSEIIPILVRVSNTELMVDGDSVNDTLRVMKSRLALRALHNISCFMADIDLKAEQCQTAALKSSVFNQLNSVERAELMKSCEMHNYSPGKKIITQGQENDTMYVISQGYAEVQVNGKTVATLPPGKEFGEISMVGGHRCNADVVVKTRMIVFALHRTAYVKHLQGKNLFREEMIKENPSNPKLSATSGIFTRGGRRKSLARVIALRKNSHGDLMSAIGELDEGETQFSSLSSLARQSGHDKSGSSFDGLYEHEQEQKSQPPDSVSDTRTAHHWNRVRGLVKPSEDRTTSCDAESLKDSLHTISVDTNHDGNADLVLVDANGDGNIDSIGLDTTGDGKIDTYKKWESGVPDVQPGSLAAILRKKKSEETLAQQRKIALTDLFYVIDKHGDGNIEEDELSEFLENVSLHSLHCFCTTFAFVCSP